MSTTGSSTTAETAVAKTCGHKFLGFVKPYTFTILTLVGVSIGFVIGIKVAETKPSPFVVNLIKMPGSLYIKLLQLTILPTIATNIITAMDGVHPRENGKVVGVSMCFILCMDILSGSIGVAVAYFMKPGLTDQATTKIKTLGPLDAPVTISDAFGDLFWIIFPDNIVGIALYQVKTVRRWTFFPHKNVTEPVSTQLFSLNIIGLIFTSFVFGIAAGASGEAGRSLINVVRSIGAIVRILMGWFLKLSPIGVCFMVAGTVAGIDDLSSAFSKLGLFMCTVVVGLALHMLIQMCIYVLASFRNPFVILYKGFRVGLLSFVTTAPLLALPEMLTFCERYRIEEKISHFVVPLSAALKGDASGVFQAVACVFFAQRTGFEIATRTYVTIALLTGFATLGIPNVPSSSIVIIITILKSIGIETKDVSLLFTVEWIMDRCRSGSLGFGHLFTAAFTQAVTSKWNVEVMNDESEDSVAERGEAL